MAAESGWLLCKHVVSQGVWRSINACLSVGRANPDSLGARRLVPSHPSSQASVTVQPTLLPSLGGGAPATPQSFPSVRTLGAIKAGHLILAPVYCAERLASVTGWHFNWGLEDSTPPPGTRENQNLQNLPCRSRGSPPPNCTMRACPCRRTSWCIGCFDIGLSYYREAVSPNSSGLANASTASVCLPWVG